MRFSNYPKGTILEVTVENPREFSVNDIIRYLELAEKPLLNNEEWADQNRVRRAIANTIKCTDCNIEIQDNTLFITVI